MTGSLAALIPALVAVAGWSVFATLAHGVKGAPVFTVLVWEFAAAAAGTGVAAWLVARRTGRPLRTGPRSVAIAALGQFGFNVLFLAALPLAPTAHVNLTAYLWPALVVLALPLIERTPFRPSAVLGAGLGFAGVALLIAGPTALAGTGSPLGYALAFACGASWAAYSLLRRFAPHDTGPTLAVAFALSALGAAAIAGVRGDPLIPETRVLLFAAAIGLIPIALANSAWDVAIRTGERGRAALLSYAVPIFSTLILVALTEERLGPTLALAALLVSAGVAWPEIAARRARKAAGRAP
ncbi:MAG: EamA family transporter [Alphaproteobacteria bacterium]|nr:EamA family transporter [Alphaproteobacteria bacterium]